MAAKDLKEGMRVHVSGYTDHLWIQDYQTNVSSGATVLLTPSNNAKKVLVCIDEIDGEHNVNIYVRISKLCKED